MIDEIRAALDPVADVFEALGVSYRVGGSVASSALGVARTTLDIDLVADLRAVHVAPFVERLQADYYVDADMIHDAIRRRASFNVIHLATMMKVDVFVLGARPFDRVAFARVINEPLGDDRERRSRSRQLRISSSISSTGTALAVGYRSGNGSTSSASSSYKVMPSIARTSRTGRKS